MNIQVTRMELLTNRQLLDQWRVSRPGSPYEAALWAEISKRLPVSP